MLLSHVPDIAKVSYASTMLVMIAISEPMGEVFLVLALSCNSEPFLFLVGWRMKPGEGIHPCDRPCRAPGRTTSFQNVSYGPVYSYPESKNWNTLYYVRTISELRVLPPFRSEAVEMEPCCLSAGFGLTLKNVLAFNCNPATAWPLHALCIILRYSGRLPLLEFPGR